MKRLPCNCPCGGKGYIEVSPASLLRPDLRRAARDAFLYANTTAIQRIGAAVLETGSLKAAAARLDVTPSRVSHALAPWRAEAVAA